MNRTRPKTKHHELKMLGKSNKEKSHGFKAHRGNTKDNYKNVLSNGNLSKILNFIGGEFSRT